MQFLKNCEVLWYFFLTPCSKKHVALHLDIIYVTQPLYETRMNWIHNPSPPPPHRTDMDYSDTPVQSSDTPVQSRDTCVKSCDIRVKSRDTHTKSRDPPVLTSDTQASAIAINASSGAPLALLHPSKSRRRRRRKNHR